MDSPRLPEILVCLRVSATHPDLGRRGSQGNLPGIDRRARPAPPRKLTPVQVLERLLTRLEKRMEALQRVKLDGLQMVISELEVEQDYLRRAMRYLEE
jgi:hypothetical protein